MLLVARSAAGPSTLSTLQLMWVAVIALGAMAMAGFANGSLKAQKSHLQPFALVVGWLVLVLALLKLRIPSEDPITVLLGLFVIIGCGLGVTWGFAFGVFQIASVVDGSWFVSVFVAYVFILAAGVAGSAELLRQWGGKEWAALAVTCNYVANLCLTVFVVVLILVTIIKRR